MTTTRLTAFALASLTLALASSARGNALGSDAQNFNATVDGLDFVTVHSSETLKPGIFNLGFFGNLAINSLPYYDGAAQTRTNFNDSLLGADLNIGVGLARNWQVGLSLPQIWAQSVSSSDGTRGEFAARGNTEIRLSTKYRLFGDDEGGFALVASSGFNRIEDNPYSGIGGGPTINVEAVADTTIGRVAVGANFGRRFRSPGRQVTGSIVRPLRDQWIASTAASYSFPGTNVKAIGELFGSAPAQTTDSYGDRSASSLEALLGAKWTVDTNWALHAGGGTGLIEGVASPDWRVYAGLNYTFGPKWSENERPYLRAVPSSSGEPVERFVTQSILFEFNSDQMIGDYPPVLAELAQHLVKPPQFKRLIIEGHTDSIGKAEYNQKLSLRRAEAIRRYLAEKHKIPASRIEAIGYGEVRPIANNGNYQGRQQNRRVEFQVFR